MYYFTYTLLFVVQSEPFKTAEKALKVTFPDDRYAQMYEQYVVNLLTSVTQLHSVEELQADIQYCMVALDHLLVSKYDIIISGVALKISSREVGKGCGVGVRGVSNPACSRMENF